MGAKAGKALEHAAAAHAWMALASLGERRRGGGNVDVVRCIVVARIVEVEQIVDVVRRIVNAVPLRLFPAVLRLHLRE